MEDVSEALLMAGSVLIFIIALTICISSFSTVRVGAENIFKQTETIDMAKDESNGEYINYIQMKNEEDITRIVGVETVIASLYRSQKENYVVYIQLTNSSDYDSLDVAGSTAKIETSKKRYVNDSEDDEHNGHLNTEKILKFTINKNDRALFDLDSDVYNKLMKELYEVLVGKKFKEYLGEYQHDSEPGVTEENKDTYRIITFIEQ